MDTIPNPGQLPRWVKEPADWYTDRRAVWLEAVHAVRQAAYRRTIRGHPADNTIAAAAVDDVVGRHLMWQFVLHRSAAPPAAPLTSPLLRCAFNPASDGEPAVPPVDEALVADASARLRTQRFPVTAFGDYHQLCLARPLHAVPGVNERRSRGVHFTPAPLVDYLTDATLSGFPGSEYNFRLLDPSCGCGVFLIAAARHRADRVSGAAGTARVQQLLDVIAESIFGIDINPRAVEWARRSLLLSAWECDPNGDHSELRVPDLTRNIATGDFLADERPNGFSDHFDAVLGGPPFVRYSQLKKDCPDRLANWRGRFVTARSGQFDLYMPFFEQAVRHLKPGGQLGWSVSNTFLRSKFGGPLRQFLGENCTLQELVEFENPKVYAEAVTQIVLVRLKKVAADEDCRFVRVKAKPDLRAALEATAGVRPRTEIDLQIRRLPAATFRAETWRLSDDGSRSSAPPTTVRTLKELGVRITQGVVTGADPVFLLRVIDSGPAGLTRVEDREGRQHLIESALLRPAARSRDVHGYSTPLTNNHLLLPYVAQGNVLSEADLAAKFPAAHKYLVGRRSEIPVTGRHRRPFYAFRNDAVLRLPPGPRILIGMVTSGADATLDIAGSAVPHAGVLVLDNLPADLDLHFLLAVLNSPSFWSFVWNTMPTMGVGRHVLRRGPLADFCVPLPSSAFQTDIAAMVRQLMSVSTTCERTRLKNTIDAAIQSCVSTIPESLVPAANASLVEPEDTSSGALMSALLEAGTP
jgi:methylase of polypeptide subunit release factors